MKEIGDRLDGKPVPTVTAGASTSLTFDDDGPVVGALVSMLPHLSIGGTVVPSLGLFEGGKLEDDHAFNLRTLKDFLAAIVCARCNGVARQRGRDFLRMDSLCPSSVSMLFGSPPLKGFRLESRGL